VDWAEWRAKAAAELAALGCTPEEAEAEAALKEERTKLRIAWALERWDAFVEAQDKVGEAYCRMMDEYPDVDWEDPDAPDLPEPPEQAVCDALYEEVAAARDRDRWPRHLHFHRV
jgi:hypothetical protein